MTRLRVVSRNSPDADGGADTSAGGRAGAEKSALPDVAGLFGAAGTSRVILRAITMSGSVTLGGATTDADLRTLRDPNHAAINSSSAPRTPPDTIGGGREPIIWSASEGAGAAAMVGAGVGGAGFFSCSGWVGGTAAAGVGVAVLAVGSGSDTGAGD